MRVINIGSGSKGNCTYIETAKTKILIDCGITYSLVKNTLAQYNIILNKIDAIFVTHEHGDHIKDLVSFLTKTSATLYIKEESFNEAEVKLRTSLKSFKHVFVEPNLKYNINELSVLPIRLNHDTKYCVGYIVKNMESDFNDSFASITDTGYIPDEYFKVLSYVHTLLIESNHDVTLLQESGRAYCLIERILSDCGHLSNVQCAEHLHKIVSKNTKHVVLAHLSEDCNEPDIALNTIKVSFDNNPPFKLEAAYQHKSTLMEIIGD